MKKTLQELTILDNFLFGAVMSDTENCRLLLERILEISIDHVEVVPEKELRYHPEYKGVRLDVYVKDDKGTRFDVEIQVKFTPIGRRSRYYHDQMDMDILAKRASYEDMPDSYVIFICDYDPFGRGKYKYTVHKSFLECPDLEFVDGRHTIILNNKGTNPEEVPEELVKFLQYTNEKWEDAEKPSEDEFVRRIQETIHEIKSSREMEVRYIMYMDIFDDMLKEEVEKKVAEELEKKVAEELEKKVAEELEKKIAEVQISTILDFLSIHGPVPASVKEKLSQIQDIEALKSLTLAAAQSESIEQFEERMHNYKK